MLQVKQVLKASACTVDYSTLSLYKEEMEKIVLVCNSCNIKPKWYRLICTLMTSTSI